MNKLTKLVGILGLVAVFSFMSFSVVNHNDNSGIASLVGVHEASAQTVLTWDTTDTDDVTEPAFTSWKTTFKWYLIFIVPILIVLYFVGRALGIFQGHR